jgi:hypothetical protein
VKQSVCGNGQLSLDIDGMEKAALDGFVGLHREMPGDFHLEAGSGGNLGPHRCYRGFVFRRRFGCGRLLWPGGRTVLKRLRNQHRDGKEKGRREEQGSEGSISKWNHGGRLLASASADETNGRGK